MTCRLVERRAFFMAVPKLQYAIGNSSSTTLAVAAANSDTTVTVTSDTNFAAKSGAGMVIIDEGESTEEIAYSASKTGSALSVPLANRGLEGGSAQAHAINSAIKGILTAGMWNDLIDSMSNILDATAGTVKSFNMPTAGSINDANANELIKFPAAVSSATNELTISNAANSSNPSITATGSSDSNISINLVAKGTGRVQSNAVTVPTISSTDTLTNKRITKRVGSTTSSATPTINTDDYDAYSITAQAADITSMTTNLSGTPTNFQTLIVRIKDDGTARAITWGASFEAKGTSLPTTTVISKVLTVGFIYDTVTSKWGCVASQQEA